MTIGGTSGRWNGLGPGRRARIVVGLLLAATGGSSSCAESTGADGGTTEVVFNEDGRLLDIVPSDATPDGGEGLRREIPCHEPAVGNGLDGWAVAPLGTGEHIGTFRLLADVGFWPDITPVTMDLWRDGDRLTGCANTGSRDEWSHPIAATLDGDAFHVEYETGGCCWGPITVDGVLADDEGDGIVDRVSAQYLGLLLSHPFGTCGFEGAVSGGRDVEPPAASCTGASRTGERYIGFEEPTDVASLRASGLRLEYRDGRPVPGAFAAYSGSLCGPEGLVFTPDEVLAPDATLRVAADVAPTDLAGNEWTGAPDCAVYTPGPLPPEIGDNGGFEQGTPEGLLADGLEVVERYDSYDGSAWLPVEGRWMGHVAYGGGLATVLRPPAGARTLRLRARFVADRLLTLGSMSGPRIEVVVIGLTSGRYARAVLGAEILPGFPATGAPPWETWTVDLRCMPGEAVALYLDAELEVRHSCDTSGVLDLLLDDIGFEP